MSLHVLNVGDIPTYDTVRGGKRYTSYVDVTACSEDLLNRVGDWRVEESLTSSDHNGITFGIRQQKSTGTNIIRTTRIFNTRKANWTQFREKLTQLMSDRQLTVQDIDTIHSTQQIDEAIDRYTQVITQTCRDTMPTKKHTQKFILSWWNDDLAQMKKLVATRRRRIRNAAPDRRDRVVALYLKEKEKYEKAVKDAQVESWKEFCRKQDKEGIWEGIYRVLNRATGREEDLLLTRDGETLDAQSSAELLAETFYPRDQESEESEEHRLTRRRAESLDSEPPAGPDDPPFIKEELKRALRSFNPKKAPGADGLTADICQHAVECNPEWFLALLNRCFTLAFFPKQWKEATVVILRKPGRKSYRVPKAYRPIGLLPVLGKIFERMLVARLRFYLLPKISPNQYGFMPQRSTEDALYRLVNHIRKVREEKKLAAVVSLDIEGAFDSAWWPAIKVRLAEVGCPGNLRLVISSYLSGRRVSVRYAGKEVSRGTDKGCVQGSIGGPILWNLLLDPLLWMLEEMDVFVQAFADDIVLVFEGKIASDIERVGNKVLRVIQKWGKANKLKFAPHKTCALLSTRKLKYDTPRLKMGDVEIQYLDEIKILGLTVDKGLTFNAHVGNVCRKAISRYGLLARTARVGWGLNPQVIRLIYTAVIEPTIMYASAAWASTVEKMGVQKRLNSVQRGFAQKICKAYRTVSLNSAMLLAGILPLDLRILEAARLYEIKKGVEHPALKDREVERMAPAIEDPHPAVQVELGFGLVDENIYPDVVNSHEHRIYTDGSKIEGRVGAALSVWKGDAETKTVKLALPPYCTVYQAELLALHRAVSLACKGGVTKVGILSDSRSALQAVTLGSPHPLAVQTREALRKAAQQRREVSLFWVKAHAGLRGNERVDQLAKDAALRLKRKPDYDLCPVSFVKRILRKDTIDEWDRRYDTGGTAGVTKLFFPSAAAAYKIVKKIDITHHTTQILTGHGGFAFYLNRFKLKEDPSCLCQPGVEETVPHLLLGCPIFASNRYDIEQKLGMSMTGENLPLILGGKKREIFLSYIKRVVKIVNRRNCDKLCDT